MRYRDPDVIAVIDVCICVKVRDLTEFVHCAVESIGALIRDLIDDTADGVAERRVGVKNRNRDLLNGVLCRAVGQVAGPRRVGCAVEQNLAGLLGRSADAPAVASPEHAGGARVVLTGRQHPVQVA